MGYHHPTICATKIEHCQRYQGQINLQSQQGVYRIFCVILLTGARIQLLKAWFRSTLDLHKYSEQSPQPLVVHNRQGMKAFSTTTLKHGHRIDTNSFHRNDSLEGYNHKKLMLCVFRVSQERAQVRLLPTWLFITKRGGIQEMPSCLQQPTFSKTMASKNGLLGFVPST